MQVVYAPGEGLLVGSGRRWVLLDRAPDPVTLQRLWELVTGTAPDLPAAVAALLGASAGPGAASPSVAVVDLAPGRERTTARGSATVAARGGVHLLAVGPLPDAGTVERAAVELPLVAGAVRAGWARVGAYADRPPGAPPLIDGIPPHLLAGAAPQPTPARPPVPAEEAPAEGESAGRASADPEPDGRTRHRLPPPTAADHDGLTVQHRGPGAAPAAPTAGPSPVLQQATHETVLAARCPAGHVTPHDAPTCRTCARPVATQDPVRVPRPSLGVLRLPDGEKVPLDRGLVLGRRPEPRAGVGDWPRLLQLPGDSTYLSRVHLQIELDGWLVIARDLGSRAGTTWHVPGRAPVRMRAHEAYVLEPGHELDLADDYRIGYALS